MLRYFIGRYLAGQSDNYHKISIIMFGLKLPHNVDQIIQLILENSSDRCLDVNAKYEQQFADLYFELCSTCTGLQIITHAIV